MALRNLLKRTPAPAALCALAIAACGSQQKPATTATTPARPAAHGSSTVVVYSSLPQRGSERAAALAIQQGIRLAFDGVGYEVDHMRIRYLPLSDSPAPRRRPRGASGTTGRGNPASAGSATSRAAVGSWSPAQTVKMAARAARNPQTVAYIGDLNSGATELSLPILNQAGIAQITPGSGYPGLTGSYKGVTQPQVEPDKYYPQTPRNLLRMIPSDIVQASAVLSVLRRGGCQAVAAWEFGGSPETTALLNAIIRTAPLYAMKYVAPPKLPSSTKAYVNYAAATLKPLNLHCAVLVGHVTAAAEVLTTELREQLGATFPVAGTDGFCTGSWARGIPKLYAKEVLPGLSCTTPYLPVGKMPKSAGFVASFRRAYHRRPSPFAYYGYEAAEMVLRALHDVASSDDARNGVLTGLVQEFVPDRPVPAFTFNNGSVASTRYGVDTFDARGRLRYHETVVPQLGSYLLTSGG